MIQYPLKFKVSSSATEGAAHPWTSTFYPMVGEPLISLVAVPPEFDGPGGGFSPEDFYSLALINCFVATFKVIAEKSKLKFSSFDCEGVLVVDRNESGVPWMSAFRLKGKITGVADADRARRLLEKTSQSCLILNSVKTEKSFEWIVEA